MRENAENDGNKMFEAIALILKSFSYGTATDLYGDLPYTAALGAKHENYFPLTTNKRSFIRVSSRIYG